MKVMVGMVRAKKKTEQMKRKKVMKAVTKMAKAELEMMMKREVTRVEEVEVLEMMMMMMMRR